MIKIKNNHKYSMSQFAGYSHRAKFELVFTDRGYMSFDVYTTNDNRAEVAKIILDNADKLYPLSHRRAFSKVAYWTTKVQDDLAGELIDSLL